MGAFPADWVKHNQIAMLIYPGFTALDLFGPQYMFGSLMGATVLLVAKSPDPVTSDAEVTATSSATFGTCPCDLTVLFTPGRRTATGGRAGGEPHNSASGCAGR